MKPYSVRHVLDAIEDARKERGISMESAAVRAKVAGGRSNWSRMISGHKGVSISRLGAMCRAVGLDLVVGVRARARVTRSS